MAEQKEVTFISKKYKGLELVHTPMGLKDEHGNNVKSVRCSFLPSAQGYAFTTKNPELIEWIKNHDYFIRGAVVLADNVTIVKSDAPQVFRGGVTTASGKGHEVEEAPAVPAAPAAGPKAYKVEVGVQKK